MKTQIINTVVISEKEKAYPYLATHKYSGTLCLVSRHCAIALDILHGISPGDAWVQDWRKVSSEENFERLPEGFSVQLVNE